MKAVIKKITTNIRYKFSLIFIALITVFAILCGTIYISNFTKQSSENYYDSSYAILSGINSRFEDYIQQINVYASFILYPDNEDGQTDGIESLRDRIDFVYDDNKNIESIFHYMPDENRLILKSGRGKQVYENPAEIENCAWYRGGITSDGELYIQPQHKHAIMAAFPEIDNDSEVFSFVKSYEDASGNRSVLCINIYESYMSNICANSLIQNSEKLQCLNKLGEVIYSTDNTFSLYDRQYIYDSISSSQKKTGHFTYTGPRDQEKKTVVYIKSEDDSNMIYKCVQNSYLNADLMQGLKMLVLLMAGILVVTIIIVIYLVRSITKPVNDLKNCLDEFSSGNMDVRIESVREDEFKDISSSFNQMAFKINQLIKEKYKLELYNRDARLYSLLAQINPHFINNILQSIGGTALERGMKDIYKSTTVLAKMLRYSIKDDNVVALEKEIENLNDYIYIQKFRFEDKLDVKIFVREGLEEISIPKFTFQPLVENAIVHGFKDKKEVGRLSVSITDSDEKILEVQIIDNGCGIDEKILSEIRAGFENDGYEIEKNHIGLCNIYRRLKYLYDEKFHMEVESIVGEGTRITLSIDRSDGENVQSDNCG